MIPNLGQRLAQSIVYLLSTQPQLTADEIRRATSDAKRRFSSAAVYKELKQLQTDGIVVKDGPRFSLSLGWIFDILAFGDRMSMTYCAEEYLTTILPEPGERQSW